MRSASAARALYAGVSVLEAGFRPRIAAPGTWREWTRELFPGRYSVPFADHHAELWDWAAQIQPGVRPRPFVGIMARGGGKTSNVEGVVVWVGSENRRSYVLWVMETQDQADKAVSNIGDMLESERFGERYPRHAERMLGKYGSSKGWRRNRLRTAGGLTIDALGLDTKARGLKVEEQRPDLVVIDDVDGKFDTPQITKKKLHTITHTILPAGSSDLAVVVIQNLITADGVVAQIADGRADMLHDRIVTGPHPALIDPEFVEELQDDGSVRVRIVGGTPTWQGQDVARCEATIATSGLRSFLEECQHEVHERQGALWTKDLLDTTRRSARPEAFTKLGVAVDPSGGGDDIGIILAGVGPDGHAYVYADRTRKGKDGPLAWGMETVDAYHRERADRVIAEVNFGGNLVESNVQVAARRYADEQRQQGRACVDHIPVRVVTSSRGKAIRAEPVAAEMRAGRVHIVGHLPALERELTSWVPGESKWSPNRLDAMVFVVTWLLNLGGTSGEPLPPPPSTSYPSIY